VLELSSKNCSLHDDVSSRICGVIIMGVQSIKICERKALELSCDDIAHGTEWRAAWFDCGSDLGNFALATAAGWSERRNAEQAWLCPQCARKNALESGYSGARTHADEVAAGKEAA
jgi:hypothetical protein